MANWCKGAISYFAILRNAKSQTPGFLVTRHKKPENAGIEGVRSVRDFR